MSDIGPGDFVECINDGQSMEGWTPLTAGRVYTVASAQLGKGPDREDVPCISLVEVPNPVGCPDGFWLGLFRPIYPGGQLLRKLMEPVPGVREECPVLTGGPLDWARQ